MFRLSKNAVVRGSRAIHQLVFVEDHSIITRNESRSENLRQALDKMAPKLNADTSTLVKLNSGYYRPNEEVEFKKGAFDAEVAVDLKGNHGPSGVWSNIARVVKARDDTEVSIVAVTNGADDASKFPMRGEYGLENMVKLLGERNPGLRFTFNTVGLDITRENERKSIRDACNWTGGDALFIDCDGADDDGTVITSADATQFFDTFNIKDAKKANEAVKAAKARFTANHSHTSALTTANHTAPTL